MLYFRCNLASVVLQMLAMGIKDIVNFDFMDKPSPDVCVFYFLIVFHRAYLMVNQIYCLNFFKEKLTMQIYKSCSQDEKVCTCDLLLLYPPLYQGELEIYI